MVYSRTNADVTKTIRPSDCHHLENSRLTGNLQPTSRSVHSIHESPGGNIPDRRLARIVIPQSKWRVPLVCSHRFWDCFPPSLAGSAPPRLFQNEPTVEPTAITVTSARIGPTIPDATMSK
jgi:hypothetical protein